MSTAAITVSVKGAAALTSLSEFEIRNAVNRAELPAVRRGTRILIRVTDLDAWISSLPSVADAS